MRIRERFTFANVASALALVLALSYGGAAVAGVGLNSVGSPQIKDGSIKTVDLRNRAVTSPKIQKNAVTSAKLKSGAVHAADLAAIIEVNEASASVASGNTAGATATCPAGTTVIGGGFDGANNATMWRVQRSHRDGNGWRAFGTNQTGSDSFLVAKAYCLK